MKTIFARSTAGIALVASLMGTAHANDDNVNAPAGEDVEQQATGANAADVAAGSNDVAVPSALLEAFNATEPSAPLLSTMLPSLPLSDYDLSTDGVVTLRALDPRYGNIDPFYGDISPFYGDIDAFWGDINPFYGTINPFYGDINPFWGDISPFYGDISPFWGDIDAFYGDIVAFDAENMKSLGIFWESHSAFMAETQNVWAQVSSDIDEWDDGEIEWSSTANISDLEDRLNEMVSLAKSQFGDTYSARTGNDFSTLADEVFARHGISPNDWEALAQMSAGAQSAFFLDWHDSIGQYSGVDQVDHWMASINWTPSVTQIQGNGRDTIIGIIDGSFTTDTDLSNNIIWAGGYQNKVGGHGAGVASLIAGAHDGEGVMGIAPDVKIATYNPFNTNGQTGWNEVITGILTMQPNGMKGANQYGVTSIINLSLGEKGWVASQGLADIFARQDIQQVNKDTVYVIASGNDGVTQNSDIEWYFGNNEATTIFVGSVNPLGEISSFSNRPGSTCLLDNGVCHAGNELYMRTVVAPGELLLLSDGEGGVKRHSGTSFAAPLVSGAIALLHDRWPWLGKNPEASSEIIFRSARDLGAPGPDEVYGWGLLDVAASQSPLDFNTMTFNMFKQVGGSSKSAKLTAASVLAAGIPSYWETDNVFFTGFENVGGTYRDFSIPVSTFTYGKSTNALGRGDERFQDYITQRFSTWINSGGSDSNGDGLPGFTELRSNGGEIRGEWTLRYDAMAPRYDSNGELRMVHGAATLTEPSGKASFTFGHGQGAMALSGYRFGIMSDHDPFTGGVNPVLGFASGETFAQIGYKLGENTTVRVGYSQNREGVDDVAPDDTLELMLRQQVGERPASAMTLDVEHKVSDAVSVGAQITMLDEENALLGVQTAAKDLLGNGSRTEAMTLSASFDLGSGFSIDVSATGARTETSKDQLFTNAGTVWATAGQFSATKHGLLSDNDTLRVSVAQPLQVERGELEFTSEQVVDRLTGEIGAVTQSFGIGTKRRITTEAVYAMPLTRSSEFGVFSRYVSAGDIVDEEAMVIGGNFSLRF